MSSSQQRQVIESGEGRRGESLMQEKSFPTQGGDSISSGNPSSSGMTQQPFDVNPKAQPSQSIAGSSTTQMPSSQPSAIENFDLKSKELLQGHGKEKPLSPRSEEFFGKKRSDLIPKLDKMSIDIGNFTFRLPSFKDHLLQTSDPEVRTVFDAWLKTVYEHGNKRAFGFRRTLENGKLDDSFTWLTYKDAEERIQVLTSGILNLGISSGQIGIFSENRPEWQLVNLAIARMKNFHLVPINARASSTELDKIVSHSEVSVIFCSGKHLHDLLKCAINVPNIRTVVCFDHFSVEQQQLMQTPQFESLNIISYYDLLRAGRQKPRQEFEFPNSEDILLINYTSGTTGIPKAVLLTHGNIIATSASLRLFWELQKGDQRFLSYLPLSHVLQYIAEHVMMEFGNSIGYWSDSIDNFSKDIAILSPTLMASVPKTAENLEDLVKKGIKHTNPIIRLLFKPAYKTSGGPKSFMGRLWEKIIFNRIKEKAGVECLQGILSGGAPLNEETQTFLQTTFHIPVLQGYGLTETCGGGAMQLPEDDCTLRIGAPLACNELRLRSVEELGYRVTDDPPQGELLIRGYNVSPGYFKDQAMTNENFLPDGFFCTGDIAQWNKDGSFSIIDRKKNILKLSQGEYVPIEHLQTIYSESELVKNIWLYGDPNHSQLLAFVYPSKKTSEKKLLKNFNNIASHHDLKGYEKIKAVRIVKKDFKDMDSTLETSSGQLRRDRMEHYFQNDIDKMFRKLRSK